MLGLIPNDPNESENNYNKLVDAMNVGYRIIVDDDYYISGSSGIVDKDIYLMGVYGSLILTSNTTSIEFSRNLRVESNKFISNFEGVPSPLFVNRTNDAIDFIEFKNNEYIGNISTLTINRNSFSTPLKIGKFTFEGNKLFNRQNLWVYLNKLDFDSIDIINNQVRNMDMQIFNINDAINSKAIVNIKGNSVVNDFDLWVEAPSMYLCFVLYSGAGRVVYKNNEVIGLKTRKGNANVYDNYLSCDHLDYENNIWQDNITVSPTRGKNGLFKAKAGNEEKIYRNCRNNKFLVTKELIDFLSDTEKEQCYVTMWDFEKVLSNFTYEGNDVDVFAIHQREYDTAQVFKFHNNTIRADRILGPIINMDAIEGSKLSIIGNTVKTTNTNVVSFYSESAVELTQSHEEIIMENNSLTLSFNYLLYSPKTKKLVMNNNTIENLNDSYTVPFTLIHYGKIGELIGSNNKVNSLHDMALIRGQSTLSEIDFSIEISRKNYDFGSNVISFTFDDLKEQSKQIVANYNLLNKTEQWLFNLFFEFGKDETGMYVKYKDSAGVWQTAYVDGTYTASVDKINTFETNVTTRVVLDSAAGKVSFRVDLPKDVVEKIRFKSFTTSVA